MYLDFGRKNLQQCEVAIIYLRAKFLFSPKQWLSIHFDFTGSDRTNYIDWVQSWRPKAVGNNVELQKSVLSNWSYLNFEQYLRLVFIYAGSYFLNSEIKLVSDIKLAQIGDV